MHLKQIFTSVFISTRTRFILWWYKKCLSTLCLMYCIASGRKKEEKKSATPSPFLSRQQAVSELRLICNYLEIIVCQNLANVTNIFRTCAVNYVRLLEDFLTLKVKRTTVGIPVLRSWVFFGSAPAPQDFDCIGSMLLLSAQHCFVC